MLFMICAISRLFWRVGVSLGMLLCLTGGMAVLAGTPVAQASSCSPSSATIQVNGGSQYGPVFLGTVYLYKECDRSGNEYGVISVTPANNAWVGGGSVSIQNETTAYLGIYQDYAQTTSVPGNTPVCGYVSLYISNGGGGTTGCTPN
jgi:hypothetical protein